MSKCYFQTDWFNNPKFSWLQQVTSDRSMAYCTLCQSKFSLSNMGLRAVRSHQQGKKHKLKEKSAVTSVPLQNIVSYMKNSVTCSASEYTSPEAVPSTSGLPQSVECINPVGNAEQCKVKELKLGSMDKYLYKDNVIRAEIMWCLHSIATHKSLRSSEKDVKVFPIMFPDSEIVKGMQLGRDKMAYTILFGIAPYFKQCLMEELLDSDHYVIGFDESLNKVSQRQQMDLNVRYWCPKDNYVKTRYLNSAFLGRSRCEDLLVAFQDSTSPLNLKKLLQISMDGPNVNKKFFKELSASIREGPDDPEILNIGSCGLHAVSLAFKTGVKATEWNIMEFLRSLYFMFKDSPARRALYSFYSESETFPLKFCSIRWLENVKVADRALNMIPLIKKFIAGVEKDKVVLSSQSYLNVKKAIKDPLLPAKLSFFQLIATEMESFLRIYQTDIPLIPFLFGDLTNVVTCLLDRFVQKDRVKDNIMEIDVNNSSIFLPYRQIDIGIGSTCSLKKNCISESDSITFRKECKIFLIACVKKLQERSPLSYELTKAASCFDPTICLKPNLFSNRVTKLLLILVQKNWISSSVADKVKLQLKEICSRLNTVEKLKSYKKSERIDVLWHDILSSEERCQDAFNVMKMTMILSHGNANIERGFSVNKDCLWDNMKEQTLNARRLVYDSLLANGGLTTDFVITKKLIHSAKNARPKFLEDRKRHQEEEEMKASNAKRKRETELELKKLESKRLKLLSDAQKESVKIEEEIIALRLFQKKNK